MKAFWEDIPADAEKSTTLFLLRPPRSAKPQHPAGLDMTAQLVNPRCQNVRWIIPRRAGEPVGGQSL